MDFLQLIINPGSTSTKVAIFKNEECVAVESLKHSVEELKPYQRMIDQFEYRKNVILAFLAKNNYQLTDFQAFVGRGGMLKPLKQGGTYQISEEMLSDLRQAKYGEHASNLGAILAYEFAKTKSVPSFIVNPVCVDEMADVARVTGIKGMERTSVYHVLNQKAIARKHAQTLGKEPEDLNLIVCHLGGGISVGYHQKGRTVDVNNALGGDGPFSPERTGTIPTFPLVEMCFSGQYTMRDVKKLLVGHGGLVAYLGTANGIEIDERIKNGDEQAKFYFEAMAYNVVKEIGSLYFVAKGEIDAILITGGLAYNQFFIDYLRRHIDPILPITVYPGEDEMDALAIGSYRVLTNREQAKNYQ